MALTDLAKYDILDLLMTLTYSDSEKSQYIYDYMMAFSGYLSEIVGDKMTEADNDTLQKLFQDPEITPEKLEQFYRDRIPDYDNFLLLAALQFKKGFLLDFYTGMLEATKKQNDSTVPKWEKIIQAANNDNWEEVAIIIRELEQINVADATAKMTSSNAKPTI